MDEAPHKLAMTTLLPIGHRFRRHIFAMSYSPRGHVIRLEAIGRRRDRNPAACPVVDCPQDLKTASPI